MYVCIDNPNPMLADYPTAYERQPGFDFLKQVPTWWDETRVLRAEMGSLYVCARRKGSTWYLGAMGATSSREVSFKLNFLARGHYQLQSWKDAAPDGADPNQLVQETLRVRDGQSLRLQLAKDGGWVGVLNPVDSRSGGAK